MKSNHRAPAGRPPACPASQVRLAAAECSPRQEPINHRATISSAAPIYSPGFVCLGPATTRPAAGALRGLRFARRTRRPGRPQKRTLASSYKYKFFPTENCRLAIDEWISRLELAHLSWGVSVGWSADARACLQLETRLSSLLLPLLPADSLQRRASSFRPCVASGPAPSCGLNRGHGRDDDDDDP